MKESGWNDVAPRYKNTEIEYKGETLPVRSEWWTDYNNMWLYTVIDKIKYKNGFYEICKERDVDGGKLFALETYDLDESLKEDTVKQGSSWVNKGKEGTHGKFRTKKAADAQRRAMFANGYKESFNPSSNDYTLTTVGDMIDGLIGNMSDDEIDSDLRTWRKISKQFNFRPAVDNIAVLIPDEGYDPADYFPFWAGEPRSVKGTDLVYYDTPFFCVKEVKNGRTFLYFDSEEAARYYVDLIDSGMDLEDQDAYSEWVDKNPLVRESLKEAVEATPSPEDASVADSIITAIEDEWKTIALYNSIITRLKDNNFADMIPVIQDIVEEENVHVGQLQKALETISPDTAKIQSGEVEAEGQLDDKSEEDLKLQEEYFSYFPENYYLVKVISDGDWVDWGILPRKSTKGKEIEDYKRDFLKKYEDVKFFAMDKNGKVLNEVRVREEDEEPAVESLKESLDDDDDIDIEGERWEDIYEYGDDTDEYDDFELAGIYGGDLTYCPICGRRLEYDEDGDQFCPKCEKSAWTLAQERRKLDKERNSESVEENSDDDLVEDWSPNEWAVRGEDQLELAMEDPGMPDDDEEDEVPSPAVQKRLRGRRFTDRDGEFLRHPAREDVSERENEKKIRDAIEDDDINPDDIVEYTLNNTPDEMLSGVVDMIDESKLEDDPAVDISDLRPDVDFEQGKKQLQEFGPVAAAVVSAVAPVVADKVLDKVLPEEQQVKSEDDDTVYGSKEDDVDESVLTTI